MEAQLDCRVLTNAKDPEHFGFQGVKFQKKNEKKVLTFKPQI